MPPAPNSPTSQSEWPTPSPIEQFESLVAQIHAMKQYCASEGIAMPESVARAVADAESVRVTVAGLAIVRKVNGDMVPADASEVGDALRVAWSAHGKLLDVVRPATPASIEWTTAPIEAKFGKQRAGFVWGMVAAAVLALTAFVIALYYEADQSRREGRVGAMASLMEGVASDPAWQAAQNEELTADQLRGVADRLSRARTEAVHAAEAFAADAGIAALATRTSTELHSLTTVLTPLLPPPSPQSIDPKAEQALRAADGTIQQIASDWGVMRTMRTRTDGSGRVPDFLLLILAGTLGAAFYNLYCAHTHIVERTFDRAEINRYIIRFFLGMVAGMVLGHFGGEVINNFSQDESTLTFSRAFLALLGGYAVESVNLILLRVAEAISTIFRGSTAELLQAKDAELSTRVEKATGEQRVKFLQELAALRTMPAANRDPEIDALIEKYSS